MLIYKYDPVTKEYKGSKEAQKRPNGQFITNVLNGTIISPPSISEKQQVVWNGEDWDIVEDHRRKSDSDGIVENSGTPYWFSDDAYDSPARYMTELGPLPDGALLEPPLISLEEAKKISIQNINNLISNSISSGFDFEINTDSGLENLHFSYDSFDQQNFADTANMATMSLQKPIELETQVNIPTSVTWNAYRNYTKETGGELVRLTLDAVQFLILYTNGALVHKSIQMEIGGQIKDEIENATSVDELKSILTSNNIDFNF